MLHCFSYNQIEKGSPRIFILDFLLCLVYWQGHEIPSVLIKFSTCIELGKERPQTLKWYLSCKHMKCLYYLTGLTVKGVVRNHTCLSNSPRHCNCKIEPGEQDMF